MMHSTGATTPIPLRKLGVGATLYYVGNSPQEAALRPPFYSQEEAERHRYFNWYEHVYAAEVSGKLTSFVDVCA